MSEFIPKELFEAKHTALEQRVDKNARDIEDFCGRMDEHIGKIYDRVNAIATDTAVINTKVNTIVSDFCIKVESNSKGLVVLSERVQIQKEEAQKKIPRWQFFASIIFFVLAAILNIIINADKIAKFFQQ